MDSFSKEQLRSDADVDAHMWVAIPPAQPVFLSQTLAHGTCIASTIALSHYDASIESFPDQFRHTFVEEQLAKRLGRTKNVAPADVAAKNPEEELYDVPAELQVRPLHCRRPFRPSALLQR